MDERQRNNLIGNIELGLWRLNDSDYARLIAALRNATTDAQVIAVHSELNQIDPPVQW